jgi:dGTP triphosphohydrolase
MNTTFQMLADQEELSPQTRDWRDKVRELAYDMEDCIDAFMVHVDDKQHDGHTVFKGLLHKLKILMASHKIANTIEQLKTRAIESSERHRRYNFVDPALNSSSSRIDPLLPWLY